MPRFWIRHAALPLIVYGLLMSVILGGGLDRRMAHDWAFSATGGWVGAHTWWAQTLLHRGGRALIWLIALAALAIFASTYVSARYCHLRRSALYIVVAMVLSAGVAGLLKEVTHVDCPWSLSEFGGERPYVALFERRPAILPHAACFPGAHSSFRLRAHVLLLRSAEPRPSCGPVGARRWSADGCDICFRSGSAGCSLPLA